MTVTTDNVVSKHLSNIPTSISLVWLDPIVTEYLGFKNTYFESLGIDDRSWSHYSDKTSCLNILKSTKLPQKIILITSGTLTTEIMPDIYDLEHLESVYIFCRIILKYTALPESYPKMHGIQNDLIFLYEVLKPNLEILQSEEAVNTTNSPLKNVNDGPIKSDVLLIYVYANNHKYGYGNLKYFIDTAVRERDGVDYIFILQQVENKKINETEMPLLPKGNAFYFQHENQCYDYGTIGWFIGKYTIGNPWKNQTSIMNSSDINNRKFNLTQYKYFIFMNSSIRGPFFPPYFQKFLSDYQRDFNQAFYWYYIFTKRINDKVKLIGCTVHCVPPLHAQSYFLTTDFIGFSLLLETGGYDGIPGLGVFGCYSSKTDTIARSEFAISTRILQADYKINCLLKKYETLDFSRQSNYACPVHANPFADKQIDGTSLEPYEVVFVKFNDKPGTLDAQERAKLYQRWMEQIKMENRTL